MFDHSPKHNSWPIGAALSPLGERFADTQFFVTGVLGPYSNAHGPNEFLHIDYAKRLTACVALVLADQAAQSRVTG